MAKRLLIMNPTSRRARSRRFSSHLTQELHASNLGGEVITSRSPTHPTELAREAVERGYDAVVAVGGDGLVNQVAQELVRSEVALGIVPAGGGNDFARGLGIPLGLAEACRTLAQESVRTVDVGRVNAGHAQAHYFFSVAVMGLAAEVNRRANRLSRLPLPQIYTLATLAAVFAYQPLRFTVITNGREGHYYGWMVAAGNTWSCAAGMALLPAAQPDDGLLDVCVIGGINRGQLLLAFPRVFGGSHVYHKGVETLRVREMRVQADSPCDIYADGERIGTLPATLSVVPQALKVIVPV